MKLLAVFLAAAVAVTAQPAKLLPRPPKQNEHAERAGSGQTSQSEQRGSQNAPFVVQILQSTPGAAGKVEPSPKKPEKHWLDGWSLSDRIAATVGIVSFLQFIALVATVVVSMWNGRRQLRAYVWVRAVEVYSLQVGGVPIVRLEIRNAGQTPAYDMEIRAGCLAIECPLPRDQQFPKIGKNEEPATKMVLHPGTESPFLADAPLMLIPEARKTGLTKEQFDGLIDGSEVRLFAFALVTYKDAFGTGRETVFCVSVDATAGKSGEAKFPISFSAADRFNTAT